MANYESYSKYKLLNMLNSFFLEEDEEEEEEFYGRQTSKKDFKQDHPKTKQTFFKGEKIDASIITKGYQKEIKARAELKAEMKARKKARKIPKRFHTNVNRNAFFNMNCN